MPWLLTTAATSLLVFPANMVVAPLGAAGHVTMLLAVGLFCLWAITGIFGMHDPLPFGSPARFSVALLWLATAISYSALMIGLSGQSTAAGRASAERWLILVIGISGIVLVISQTVRTLDDATVLVRALLRGMVFCSIVAIIQFFSHWNPMELLTNLMVGFKDNGGNTVFQARDSFLRSAGSTFHPIELGVLTSMFLPLSIWRGLFDRHGRKWIHWLQTVLLFVASISTLSRSTMLTFVAVCAVFIPFLPTVPRRWAFVAIPVAVLGLFVAVPGVLGSMYGAISAGSADTSITWRTQDYPLVIQLIRDRPMTGTGPGTYAPISWINNFDNQYLLTSVELGVPGLLALLAYLLIPGVTALIATRYTTDPMMRALAGAIAAACLAAGLGAATFDALSFPVFAIGYPFFVGLSAAVWIMVKNSEAVAERQAHYDDASSQHRKQHTQIGEKWIRSRS